MKEKHWFVKLLDAYWYRIPKEISLDNNAKRIEFERAIELLSSFDKPRTQCSALGTDSRGILDSFEIEESDGERKYIVFHETIIYRYAVFGGVYKTHRKVKYSDYWVVRYSAFYERTDGGLTISSMGGSFHIVPA